METPNFQEALQQSVQMAKNIGTIIAGKTADILEDPIGSKHRRWEHFDQWFAAINCLAVGRINRRFLYNADCFPSMNRPGSMKIPHKFFFTDLIAGVDPNDFYNKLDEKDGQFFQKVERYKLVFQHDKKIFQWVEKDDLNFLYQDYLASTMSLDQRKWFGFTDAVINNTSLRSA